MDKKPESLFKQLQVFENQIDELEGKILELEQKISRLLDVQRNHMIRIKNKEELSDDFIHNGRSYQDLSPEKAWKLYNSQDYDYLVIDVTSDDYAGKRLSEAMHIPWEFFHERFLEIGTHTTPLFIISEDGANSVLACEFLVKRGFFNCNNISGGYKFWLGYRLEGLQGQTA